jgi:hypothetical protein
MGRHALKFRNIRKKGFYKYPTLDRFCIYAFFRISKNYTWRAGTAKGHRLKFGQNLAKTWPKFGHPTLGICPMQAHRGGQDLKFRDIRKKGFYKYPTLDRFCIYAFFRISKNSTWRAGTAQGHRPKFGQSWAKIWPPDTGNMPHAGAQGTPRPQI